MHGMRHRHGLSHHFWGHERSLQVLKRFWQSVYRPHEGTFFFSSCRSGSDLPVTLTRLANLALKVTGYLQDSQ
jgi:hypothetical protein